MHAWERRLKDLAQLLANCHSTYFEPDLFRGNVNQFLQTSRTVTFIIQKNKDSIPGYEDWYPRDVQEAWGKDPVMVWARDSRNHIEKEGDLELNSTFSLRVVFSYLEETDKVFELTKAEVLYAGVKALGRLARRKLPTGIADAAVVKIERRWVAGSLPTWELLQALSYVYGRVYDCCLSLARRLGHKLETSVPAPRSFNSIKDEARRVLYLKLSSMKTYSVGSVRNVLDKGMPVPEKIQVVLDGLKQGGVKAGGTMDEAFHFLTQMAVATFDTYGNHVPMLFIYDDTWSLIDMSSTNFADQADKYIFWRCVAEKVSVLRAHAIAWISESWIRNTSGFDDTVAVRNLPIVGEVLSVVMLDKLSGRMRQAWSIKRNGDSSVRLEGSDFDELKDGVPFYLIPVTRALGLPDPENLYDEKFALPKGPRTYRS